MSKDHSDSRITLSCPQCGQPFSPGQSFPGACTSCGFAVHELHGVPVLRQYPDSEAIDYTHDTTLPKFDSSSLQASFPFIQEAFTSDGLILELGAGCDSCHSANLVKTDAYLYSPGLDYVIDAHALPFADNTFDYCFSLAVFEHLHSPWIAASEIHRVLKPGGKVLVLTAFMQHVHGYPSHYFNMTEMGLRRIFDQFTILDCYPSPHTPLNQISEILLDVLGMVDATIANPVAPAAADKKADLERLRADMVGAINGLGEHSADILAAQQDTAHWSKIAPGIEIIAQK